MDETQHRRGLQLLGMWPGTFDSVRLATDRAGAARALADLQSLAKAAKRAVARKYHPDLAGNTDRQADLAAALSAADWVAGAELDSVWAPPTRARGRVRVTSHTRGVRIAWRPER